MNLNKPTYITAVKELVSGNIGGFNDGPIERIKFFDGQTPPSESEIQAKLAELKAAEPIRQLRIQRNQLLQQTDWRMTEDYPFNDKEAWKAYRQALRDLPANSSPALDEFGNLTNIIWPEEPTNAQ